MRASPDQRLTLAPEARTPRRPAVVLDTNAVMDWMVFKNPSCATWTMRFGEEGDVCWLASRAMREELAHVLGRGVARTWAPSLDGVWSAWERYAITVPVQSTCVSAHRIRCRDADDQKFIDLALAHGVRWLVSRDKALLALKRRLRPLGLEVLTPDAWNASTA